MSADTEMDRLRDEAAIAAVAVRYCWALDERRWEELDDVFVPEATARLVSRSDLIGREAIVARCRAALDPLDASQHIVSNHQVWIDGDTARHRCQLQAQHVRAAAEDGPNYILAGRYVDELVRTNGGWRITHRELIHTWTEGNRGVVAP